MMKVDTQVYTKTESETTPMFLSVNDDYRVACAEYGDPTGLPILFLHGTPGSRLLAGLFDEHAADAGVRLLAVDWPGFGRSPRWQHSPRQDTEWLLPTVINQLDIEAVDVVAFSGGSRHALGAVTRSGSRIDRVDIVSGAVPPDIRRRTPPTQGVIERLATSAPVVLRGMLRMQVWLAERLDPDVVVGQYTTGDPEESVPPAVAEQVRADFVEALSSSSRGVVAEFRTLAEDWDIDFTRVDTDVRLWHGEKDTNVPVENVRRFESEIPTADLTVLKEADHLQTLLRSVPIVLERCA